MIEQKLLQVLRTLIPDLNAHGGSVAARLELTFKRSNEIADLFVVDVQVTIARNTELIAAIHVESRKQALNMNTND